jgi:chorismate synthase
MSIQAVKGVEVGEGFEVAGRRGSEAHDPIVWDEVLGAYRRESSLAGGTEGGISNGQPVVVRAAMKPIATTLLPQPTVDLASGADSATRYERSDFCPVPRAVPILEGMMAFVLAQALLEKIGGDSLNEMKPRFESLRRATLADLQMDNTPHVFWE